MKNQKRTIVYQDSIGIGRKHFGGNVHNVYIATITKNNKVVETEKLGHYWDIPGMSKRLDEKINQYKHEGIMQWQQFKKAYK